MLLKKQYLKKIIKEELNRILTESAYTVSRGDSLSKIARSHGVSLDALLISNAQFDRSLLRSQGSSPGPNDREGNTGRNPNWIYPGETIQIPGSTEGGPSSARASTGPISGLEWPEGEAPGTSSSPIPGLEVPEDWPDRHPPTPRSTPTSSSPPPEVAEPSSADSRPTSPTPQRTARDADVSPPVTVATPGSGPISVRGTGGRTHELSIDRSGRLQFGGRTYSLEADVMSGVGLDIERIDASSSPVTITVDPDIGRSQTKPIRMYGIEQMERGMGSSEFRVDPDPSGPDPDSSSIIFVAV